MRDETIAEFINCSRGCFRRQDKGAAPNRGTKSKKERQEGARPKWGGSKQESKEGPDPVVGSGVSGCAQVTAVSHNKLCNTSDLAGTSPHAPHSPRRGRPKKVYKKSSHISIRVDAEVKAKAEAKAKRIESDFTNYVTRLIVEDVGLPIDKFTAAFNRGLKKAHIENSIALNRVGNLLNQIAAAVHRLQPCPLTRDELDAMQAQFSAACKAHLKRVMVNDN